MSNVNCRIRVGTSGWCYDHWKEVFYPGSLPKTRWLEHYTQHFDTVEINNTFYQLPQEQTLQRWHNTAPEGFLYAVKANRYITHIRRLQDAAESLDRFFHRVRLLQDRLGPVLYQLPPSLHKDLELLRRFLGLLPRQYAAVFEFRHESWYSDDTFELLTAANAALCIHDMAGSKSPRLVTAKTIYVRLHGTGDRYAGSYPKAALQNWATWIKTQVKSANSIYVYFNNDIHGHAIKNARQLRELIR